MRENYHVVSNGNCYTTAGNKTDELHRHWSREPSLVTTFQTQLRQGNKLVVKNREEVYRVVN